MGRVAVTDGMDEKAIEMITEKGHEVVVKHYTVEELLSGVLLDFDAVVVRSATKLTRDVISSSVNEQGGLRFIGRAGLALIISILRLRLKITL